MLTPALSVGAIVWQLVHMSPSCNLLSNGKIPGGSDNPLSDNTHAQAVLAVNVTQLTGLEGWFRLDVHIQQPSTDDFLGLVAGRDADPLTQGPFKVVQLHNLTDSYIRTGAASLDVYTINLRAPVRVFLYRVSSRPCNRWLRLAALSTRAAFALAPRSPRSSATRPPSRR